MCTENNFDHDNNYCKNWQIFDGAYKDEDGYISFKTTHFSVYAGAFLTVLNFQSNGIVGSDWTVYFNTYGQSDLTIEASDGTEYGQDLELVGLFCGDIEIPNAFSNNKVFVSNYNCEGQTSRIVNKPITGGMHQIKILFWKYCRFCTEFLL